MTSHVTRLAAWSNGLNANEQWEGAVNAALDQVGLTEEYIQACKDRSGAAPRVKGVKDHIWGMIELDPSAVWLIDGPLLQRLRSIKQLGFSYLTYPSAQHTRFEHSLGVYHVVTRLLTSFQQTKKAEDHANGDVAAWAYDASSPEAIKVCHAALLHDIGHGAFSHASEHFFKEEEKSVSIGPFTLKEFLSNFRRKMRLGDDGIVDEKIEGTLVKKLSEVVSAAIVTSKRFRSYYEVCPKRPEGDVDTITNEIAALILGFSIDEGDRALPQIMSGPVDADKIDYMIRDAKACGISLSIDISRLFFRAGAYEIKNPDCLSYSVRSGIGDATPVKLFIIDQSGTDAVEEMGTARLSLYSRVYHHQLTRNAEAQFHAALSNALVSTDEDLMVVRDVLSFWALNDATALDLLRRSNDSDVSHAANIINERHLLKRSAAIGNDVVKPTFTVELSDSISEAVNGLRVSSIGALSDKILANRDTRRELTEQVSDACRRFRELLKKANIPENKLPNNEEISEIRFVPPPKAKHAVLPQALVLTPSLQVDYYTTRETSYRDSGRLAQEKGWLLVEPKWREIALLAFQNTLFWKYPEANEISVSLSTTEATEKVRDEEEYKTTWDPKLKALYRPILDLEAIASTCRLDTQKLRDFQYHLADNCGDDSPYIQAPQLYKEELPKNLDDIYQNLKLFGGEGGWEIKKRIGGLGSVEGFLAQFPPSLRDHAANMLANIKIFDRLTVVSKLFEALHKIPQWDEDKDWAFAPLTPSSGTTCRTFLKDKERKNLILFSSLEDALANSGSDTPIVLYDDNIASGTQASRQIKLWLGQADELPKANSNYFTSPVRDIDDFKKRNIFFTFALGQKTGCDKLFNTCVALGLNILEGGITFGENLTNWSGAVSGPTPIDDELRHFLKHVGKSIIEPHIKKEIADPDEIILECNNRALGYDNIEGLAVTLFNTPTSMYTALWRPGVYVPESRNDSEPIAWRPLFIRQGMLRDLVLS